MEDNRPRSPDPAAPPQVQLKPGMARELTHRLGRLAEVGIDVDNIDVPDLPLCRPR